MRMALPFTTDRYSFGDETLLECHGRRTGLRSLLSLYVHVVIRLDPPPTLPAHEDFHQLRLHDAIRQHDDAARHGLHSAHFVVDIEDREIRSNEANAEDVVMFSDDFV